MRIVYLAWHGSVHTRRWAGWFAERGHDVHVVTCGGGDVRDTDIDGRALPLRYRVHELGTPRAGKLGYVLKLHVARRAVRALDPEVLHAHWLTSYGLLALAAVRKRDALVVTAHGDDVLIAPRNPLLRGIVRRVLRRARLITVPSDPMRDAVVQLLEPVAPPAAGIAVFQYGVESGRLAAAGTRERVSLGRREGAALRVVSARALLDLYRIDALLDALALLTENGTSYHCDLLGDGPAREALEAQAAKLGIADYVTFHGNVHPAQVERYVARSDAYVSVSESDGVSLALLEALALGAVPVLSDIPANRPWVNDGSTGMLVAIDPADIAHGITRAASLDRERVAADNLAVVAERADRDTNLAACELLVDSLVGVTWDASPVVADADDPRAEADADAA
ncbi:MAG: glycosyl transferase family 1 [Thermoleophilia bacterium]|nr:glycosyl transferase family 1 [Thermoleophilia bacterium]